MLYLPLLFISLKDVENWKRFKKDHGNDLGDGENVLYSKTLRLSKEKSVLKVYTYKVRDAKGQWIHQSVRGRHLKSWCSEEAR